MRKGFPIKIYMGGLPHESYFIALTLQGQLFFCQLTDDKVICYDTVDQ